MNVQPIRTDPIPISPPPEVLAEMATASGAQDRLTAGGLALHFTLDALSGRLSIQVTDLDGGVLRTASPCTAFAVAAGEELSCPIGVGAARPRS